MSSSFQSLKISLQIANFIWVYHWQAGEELVAGRVPVRARIEYQSALTLPGPAELRSITAADGMDVCAWLSMDGRVHSSMAIRLQAAVSNNA